ncbi:MAG: serine hydrolase [Deltaproteobacteria bacterium]|nr:serine hydrolase [Deltaproteobacteria bacterium]
MKTSLVNLTLSLAALTLGLVACTNGAEPEATATPAADPAPLATQPIDMSAFERTVFDGATKTEGVVVQHEGKIVYEKYAAGYDEKKRHLAYSVSKSVGSALLGIAVEEGLVALEDSICKYIPAAKDDQTRCETKLRDVVQMTSGLSWNESYDNPAVSNVLPMLYGDEPDTGAYAASQPRVAPAGTRWAYSSGDSNILARAIRTALGGKDMRAWARERLFAPAGLSSAILESDRSGTLLFSSGLFMTPRDMARFGQLYLDDGMIGGKRVLPSSWVAFSKTPAAAVASPRPRTGTALGERGGSYGAAFWLNAATPTAPTETLTYATAPNDLFCAQGNWGQRICVVPSRKLVVVRVGNDRVGFYDVGPAVAAAVAAVDAQKTKGK